MHLEEERRGRVTIFRIAGDLDLHSAPYFRERVDGCLEGTSAPALILDLSEVGVIDSSGLGALIGRFRKVRDLGGEMVLIGASPTARRVAEMGGLTRLVPILPSEQEAVSRLAGGETVG